LEKPHDEVTTEVIKKTFYDAINNAGDVALDALKILEEEEEEKEEKSSKKNDSKI